MRTNQLFSIITVVAFGAVGCGDIGSKPAANSSTGGGVDIRNGGVAPTPGGFGSFDSGLDGSASVSELTEQQFTTACNNFGSYLESRFGTAELEQLSCNFEGYFSGSFSAETDEEAQMICVETRDRCLQANEPLDIGCPFDDIRGCEITVDEAERCYTAQATALTDLQSVITCDQVVVGADFPEGVDPESIPECEAVNSCDEFVGEPDPVPRG